MMTKKRFVMILWAIADGLADKIRIGSSICEDDALEKLYTSSLYANLEDEKTKRWYYSVPKLYELYKEETLQEQEDVPGNEKRRKSKTLPFKVFCIEMYKSERRMKGRDVVQLFKQYGVLEYLGKHYEVLHSYGARYLVWDIGEFIKVRQVDSEKHAVRKKKSA